MDLLSKVLSLGNNIKSYSKKKGTQLKENLLEFSRAPAPPKLQKAAAFMQRNDPLALLRNAPKLDQAKKISFKKNPLLRTGAEIGQLIANTPSEIFRSAGKAFTMARDTPIRSKSDALKLAGATGELATNMAGLVLGGGAVKKAATTAFQKGGQVLSRNIIKEGAKTGAKQGLIYGSAYGASEGAQEGDNVSEQARNIIKRALQGGGTGLVFGAGLGAGTSAAGLATKMGVNEVKNIVDDIKRLRNPYSKKIVSAEDFILRDGEKVPMSRNAVSREAVTVTRGASRKQDDRYGGRSVKEIFVDTIKEPFEPKSGTGKFIMNPKMGLSIEDISKEAKKYKTYAAFEKAFNIKYRDDWSGSKSPKADEMRKFLKGVYFHGTSSEKEIKKGGFKKGEYWNGGAYFADTPERAIDYKKQNRGSGSGSAVFATEMKGAKLKEIPYSEFRAINKGDYDMEDVVASLKRQGYDGVKTNEIGETLLWNTEKASGSRTLKEIFQDSRDFEPKSEVGKFLKNPKMGLSVEDVTKGKGKVFEGTVYRGEVDGEGNGNLGNFFSAEKDRAQFYVDFKNKKLGTQGGKVIEENVRLENPLRLPEENLEAFEGMQKQIPALKKILKTMYADEDGTKTDESIVAGEKLIQAWAKKNGHDGVIFGDGAIVIPFNRTAKKVAEEGAEAVVTKPKTAQEVMGEAVAPKTDESPALGQIFKKTDPPKVMTTADLPEDGQKLRGFQTTVKDTLGTPPEVAFGVDKSKAAFYDPLSNKEVVDRLMPIVTDNEGEALRLARTGDSTEGNAAAMLMIDKFLKNERFEEARQLIEEVSPRFTDQGQKVQILSLYGRLTPTGAIKFAQRVVDEANKKLSKGKQIYLTQDNIGEISKLAEGIKGLQEGTREYAVAVAKMMDSIASVVPPSLGQKLATIQTMAQLLNPKTAIRNILGNGLFAALEQVSDVVGAGLDKAVATKTGQRSVVLPDLKVQLQGGKEGFKMGLEDAILGIDTGNMGTQFDIPNKTFRDGFLGELEKALNIELRATDRGFYTAAFKGSLDNQMRAAGVDAPKPEMLERAHYEAMYRTFQDDSVLAKFLSGTKKVLNAGKEFGLGDFVLKYPKTPGNLVSRGIDYSPAGFLKALLTATKPMMGRGDFDQRLMVQELSRALVGSGIIASSYVLAKLGIMTASPEKDYEIAATQRTEGQSPFTINLSGLKRYVLSGFNENAAKPIEGDIISNYDWLQPTAIGISMGANAALNPKANKKDLITGQINTALQSLQSSVDTVTQQPVVKGIADFAYDYAKPGGGLIPALTGIATNAPASFIPSLLNQVGQLFDNTSRNSYDPNALMEAGNKVMAKIPGVRNTLEPRVDVWGDEQQMYKLGGNNVLNVFLNPAFMSRYVDKPEAGLVLDIFNRSGETQQAPRMVDKKLKINGETLELEAEQVTEYQTFVGEKTKEAFARLAEDKGFGLLSDEEKAKRMGNILSDINTAAKVELFGQDAKKISKGAKEILLGTGGDNEPLTGVPDDVAKSIYLYDLEKYTKANDQTGIKKFTFEKDKASVARQIFDGATKYEDIPEEEKASIYEAMGLKAEDVEYDAIAYQPDDAKGQYLIEQMQSADLDHASVLQALAGGRVESIGGRMLASDGVLDDLYHAGIITDAEKKSLKKLKLGRDGQLKSSVGSGGGSGKKKSSAALNSLIKEIMAGPDVPKTKTASAKSQAVKPIKLAKSTVNTDIQSVSEREIVAPSAQDIIRRASVPSTGSNVAEARRLVESVRGGGSTARTPVKLSQSFFRGGR